MATGRFKPFTNTVSWNLLLLTIGAFVFSIGINGIAVHNNLLTGGIFGSAMVVAKVTGLMSASIWFFILNIPIFLLGWRMVGKRFALYSFYGFFCVALVSEFMVLDLNITDPFLATITCAVLVGAGGGFIIRSLGSDGGTTIIAIILNQKYGVRIGQTYFITNTAVLVAGWLSGLPTDKVLYSLIMIYIAANITDYFGSLFNQRKMAWIISTKHKEIAAEILNKLHRGATMVHATGAFSSVDRTMLLTVVHNYQIKDLEEIVYANDDKAFVIIENTFNVLGSGFSSRKRY